MPDTTSSNETSPDDVLLARALLIPGDLADRMERMAGFRNVAVHDYRKLDLALVEDVICNRLDDLLGFSRTALKAGYSG